LSFVAGWCGAFGVIAGGAVMTERSARPRPAARLLPVRSFIVAAARAAQSFIAGRAKPDYLFRALLLSGIILALSGGASRAQTINTITSWNGSSSVCCWGVPYTSTYGETITPTATQEFLSSFTFELNARGGATAQYQAYVYQWNSITDRTTGPALFTSSVMTAPSGNSFNAVSISTGRTALTPGLQYVLFLTTSGISQPNPSSNYLWGGLNSGSGFVFNNGNFSSLSTTSWSTCCVSELAFIAAFGLLELPLPPNAPTNPLNVANGINNSTGTLPAALQNLYSLSPQQLVAALTQLDGEAATGAEHTAFELITQFLGFMLDPFVDGRFGSGPTGGSQAIGFAPDEVQFLPPEVALAYASILNKAAPAPFVQRWTAWGTSYGGGQFTSGNATTGSSNLSAQIFGFAGGMDYHYSPDTIVGFALGGAGLNWGLSGGMGGGRSDSFQSGVYGITRFGPAYLAGSFAFGNNWMTTNRTALGDQLTASFDAQSYGIRLEGGYRYAVLPNFGVTPYAAVQPQAFHTPGFSETDLTGGGLGLSFASMNATDVRTEIGARLDSPNVIAGMPVILRGRLAWAHDFVGNPALGAAFESLPGSNFTVNGAPIPNDSALASAGAEIYLTPRWTLLAKFDGEFAPGSQTYGGSGTLRYIW
jgi:hypothetical protein